MKTRSFSQPESLLPSAIARAMAELRRRLQNDYENAYPGLGEIIRLVLEEEETRAWELTSFPHLLLPDMVEAHIATLGLDAPEPRRDRFEFSELLGQPVLALAC